MPTPSPAQDDPRIYFAAERTFLAWIRTGLALMGVGFAVARFGLFLRQMALTNPRSATPPHSTTLPVGSVGISVPSGVGLVLLGVVVLALACVSHIRTTRHLREGSWIPGQVSKEAIALSVLLAATGIAMASYLLVIR